VSNVHHDPVSGLQHAPLSQRGHAPELPRWPANGLSPVGPHRQPGPGEDPAETERRCAGRNGLQPTLRVPPPAVTRVKRVLPASYAGERRGAVGASASERPALAGRLGNYANNSVDMPGGEVTAEDLRWRHRMALRATGRRLSRLKSRPRAGNDVQMPLRKCGAVSRATGNNVRLKVVAGRPYAEGVVHCGSIHGCAICGANIRNRRAQIYSASAARWLDAGNTLLMITLTFPHDMGMALDPLWTLVSRGVSSLTSSQAWRELKAELGTEVYYRRAIEQTHGLSGWHPHCHMLVYIRGGGTARVAALIGAHFREFWPRWVTRHGYRVPNEHGVDVQVCQAGGDAGSYIVKTQDGAKVGNELIRSDLKTGRAKSRTPLQVLDDAGRGDEASKRLWWEFEKASQGRRAITQSQGLAAILGEDEATDQELADAEAGGDAVAECPGEVWTDVIRKDIEVPVLEAVPHGLAAVNDVLRSHGCGMAYVPVLSERGS
jgi:hypothetical protein